MNQSLELLQQLTDELQKRETEKIRLQAEFDTLFNLCPDMLCIATMDGYLKRVNPSFTRVLGHTVEELQSRPFSDFVHPDDRDRTADEMHRIIVTNSSSSDFRNRYLKSDGSYQWVEWRSQPESVTGLIYACGRAVQQ